MLNGAVATSREGDQPQRSGDIEPGDMDVNSSDVIVVVGNNKGLRVVEPAIKRRIFRGLVSDLRDISGATETPHADQAEELDMKDVGRDEGAEVIEENSEAMRDVSESGRSQLSLQSASVSGNRKDRSAFGLID